MKSCKETHEHCNALEDSLKTSCPTRLLEISQTIPRLVCPPAGAHLAYTALSHCWGGGLPIKTISSNFLDHQAGIDMSSLPQTYRDAITVSRRLGIDYIWIDSLCIIQDDAEDWAREASRMASVYEGAQITVVAAWGRDGSSGCFHHPKPTLVIEAFEKNNQSTSGTVTTKRLFLRPRPDTRFLKRSHLSTRAWTFQEVSLSRRVVVFSDDQLYWQCTTLLESEDKLVSANHLEGINNALPSLGLTIRQAELPTWDLYYEWGMACDAYARRQLTFPKDKFAALAGVTQVF
ncbi:HET-domain-containing protein, partial [Polyplosphaeria fusca]